MRLLSHFPAIGIANTYVAGPSGGGEAILVDPGLFDVSLLELIEKCGFDIKAVLITHDHWNHVQGLRTLLKVYQPIVYAGRDNILGFPAVPVVDGTCLRAAGFEVEVLDVQGHSPDSRVYRLGSYIFTGDVLSAGRVGSAETDSERDRLVYSIGKKLLTLDDSVLILPGHGPPTTVEAEKNWNPDFQKSGFPADRPDGPDEA